MVIKYSYKGGELSGYIEPNGSYTGDYKTSASNGTFNLRFESDGSAEGDWHCTSCMFSVNDSLSIDPD